MARSVATERRMLQMAATDIRLLELGDTLAMLWVRLVAFILEHGSDGVFVAGHDGAPTLAGIATFRFRLDETQLKTYLETYAETRLITWDETRGAIGLPDILMPSRRVLASRENGKKGGRPRNSDRITPQNDPRQRHAIMPIAGGRTVQPETQTETHETSRAHKLSLACTDQSQDKLQARIETCFQATGRKAFDAAGFDIAKDRADWGIVRQYVADALRAGLNEDEAERLILGEIARVTARVGEKGGRPSHLGYFKPAIAQAIARRDVPAPVLSSAADYEAKRAYDEAQRAWVRDQIDGKETPEPMLSDFLARARSAA
ncbi:hypothetical protein HLH33_12990 [Gluconacetobacter diazotrophicus]|uniref:Phage protein n=1 Tax=Gluconacetobacter diazotrophicus TaxID=33996 RepID=A0A7W4NMU5_GLUDI|nr:hypothetical protein [Gluconacetobacter diazotrophicus]MBB2157215.1 hypothetical protein [Gluconacetobacter diazotrophicus]